MTLPFKPMLSASLDDVDLSTLRYPLLASPKLDGVRCIVWNGVAYSRNAKPIRNRFVQKWAEHFHNIDGELIVGSPTHDHTGEPLGRTQSGVMSFEGEPDFRFYLFDTPDRPHNDFLSSLNFAVQEFSGTPGWARVTVVDQIESRSVEELMIYEEAWLRKGYEGVMLRRPNGPYKNGRSTLNEGHLLKLKRFQDGEAVVVEIEEGRHNVNALERDELGRAKRSRDSSGLVPNGMVGTLICRSPEWGELRVAPGKMTRGERVALLQKPESIVGRTIHWRSFGYGVKDKPRFPRYYGVREDV